MTVSSSTNKVSYSGNGSLTTFAYTFKIFDQSDVVVILRASDGTETTQTITTHYTVSGVGSASGGNVVFGTAPASGVTVVIIREQPLTQGLDLVANDPFPAESLEEALDKVVFMSQKHEEELSRAIKASRTNTLTGSEFTISASDRANKVFSFDASGDLAVTQELGTFKGNWATSTTYVARDIVKDTSTNNIFIVNADHTSSGAQPLTTNANSAKYDLIVDAASATTSATNAAASATAAANDAADAEKLAINAEDSQFTLSDGSTTGFSALHHKEKALDAQTAAETAQTAAEAALDSFDDRYLGAKSTSGGNPTVDNDGDALIDGALFFDTTNNVLMVYNLGTTTWLRTTPTSSDQTAINAVNADATDIGTVAAISTDIESVANKASFITADFVSDLNTLATTDVVADLNTLATSNIVADINLLATTDIVNDLNTLATADIVSDLNTLATTDIVADLNQLATSDFVADLNTMATTTNVNNLSTVAGDITNINAVAGDATDIGVVAADLSGSDTIGTVAGGLTNINTVAGSITNVNDVASNITGVNSFAERYRVDSSDPTTSLNAGDLFFNTNTNAFKFYDAGNSLWQTVNVSGIGSVADDSTPQLGGNLDINSNDITGTGNINITGTVSGSNLPENVLTATASGAISNGDVVSLNTDGTVTPSGDVVIPYETGSLASINTMTTTYEHARMWITNTKFVVAYQGSTGDTGSRLKIGTVSGTTITYGTSIQIHSHQTSNAHLELSYDPDLDLILVHYDYGSTTATAVRVFSYSGTTLTAGGAIALPVEFIRVSSFVYDPDQNTHILVGANANNSLRGTAVPITISGTTPTAGTAVVFDSSATWGGSVDYDTVNQKHVILYSNDTAGDDAYAVVGSLSGGTLSYGTTTALYTNNSVRAMAIVYDVASGKMVAAWSRMNDFGFVQQRIRVRVLTVSGTSVSGGTTVAIDGASSSNQMQLHGLSYSAALQKTIVLFNDLDANVISSEEGTISGTDITFANRTTVLSTFWDYETHFNQGKFVLNSDNQFIGAVRQAYSGQVHSLDVYIYTTTSTTNNADNYIGVANAAYSDGATATIQILGSIDDAQSGLTTGTTYFVANDGSLSTTNNGRKIGRATSTTEILIDTAMSGSEMNAYLGGLV